MWDLVTVQVMARKMELEKARCSAFYLAELSVSTLESQMVLLLTKREALLGIELGTVKVIEYTHLYLW